MGMIEAQDTAATAYGGWRKLLSHSPFSAGPAMASSLPPSGVPEFRGVVEEGGEVWVNLYSPESRHSTWCVVPGSLGLDINIESYDPVTSHLLIRQSGRLLDLVFHPGRVSLPANIAPLVITAGPEPATTDEDERKAFVRQLPPDAREMLEQVQRRRNLRVPLPPGEPSHPRGFQ